MKWEADDKVREAPLVAILVVTDPESGRGFSEQLREEEHETEDEDGVEQGVPHRQLVHREAEDSHSDADVILERIMVMILFAEMIKI